MHIDAELRFDLPRLARRAVPFAWRCVPVSRKCGSCSVLHAEMTRVTLRNCGGFLRDPNGNQLNSSDQGVFQSMSHSPCSRQRRRSVSSHRGRISRHGLNDLYSFLSTSPELPLFSEGISPSPPRSGRSCYAPFCRPLSVHLSSTGTQFLWHDLDIPEIKKWHVPHLEHSHSLCGPFAFRVPGRCRGRSTSSGHAIRRILRLLPKLPCGPLCSDK